MLTATPANQICPLISHYTQAFSQNSHEFPRLSWYQQNHTQAAWLHASFHNGTRPSVTHLHCRCFLNAAMPQVCSLLTYLHFRNECTEDVPCYYQLKLRHHIMLLSRTPKMTAMFKQARHTQISIHCPGEETKNDNELKISETSVNAPFVPTDAS